jgi:hypothetical protein
MDSPDSGFLLIIGGLLEWGSCGGTAAGEGFRWVFMESL